jgi:putative two-component system response regulator
MSNRLALIVEDDPGLCTIYDRVLSDIGYDVLEAADGEIALKLLDHHTPDILFLDILLPRVSGKVILEKIRQEPRLHEMLVIIVSSNRQPDLDLSLPNKTEFILKPIRPAQIRDLASDMPA